MAFDKTPTTWIPNYSFDGTNLIIPLASLPGLQAADANATSGDIREIGLAVNEVLYQGFNALATTDQPKSMRLSRSTSSNDQTGYATRSYSSQFKVSSPTVVVAPETAP